MLVAIGAVTACRQTAPPPPAASAPAAQTGTVPHGDHNPHHGGIVMMKGDLHYEVVIDPAGSRHQVYFTDAVREDLPASIASSVALTIHRASHSDERVAMQIDEAGESWIGHGEPVVLAKTPTVGVSFSIHNEPYSIELPLAGPATTDHSKR
jgi:hypothetical protein